MQLMMTASRSKKPTAQIGCGTTKEGDIMRGIDVSAHNGSIDWNRVKNDGIISAISLISAIALMILIHIKVASGDTAGFQMAAFIAGIGIFMIGSLLLALIGGIAGIIMTIVTFVTRRTGIVWMPIVSMTASVASVIITMAVM